MFSPLFSPFPRGANKQNRISCKSCINFGEDHWTDSFEVQNFSFIVQESSRKAI